MILIWCPCTTRHFSFITYPIKAKWFRRVIWLVLLDLLSLLCGDYKGRTRIKSDLLKLFWKWYMKHLVSRALEGKTQTRDAVIISKLGNYTHFE